jgi:hypothetical protein
MQYRAGQHFFCYWREYVVGLTVSGSGKPELVSRE